MGEGDEKTASVLTIGHSNHAFARFLAIALASRVGVIVDVRSRPYSKFAPHFSRPELEKALADAGIGYRYLGDGLGGRPNDPSLYEGDHVAYDRVAATPQFSACLDEVIAASDEECLALLCAEEDPARCHRHLMIAPALRTHGVEVAHIRGDATIEDDEQVRVRRTGPQTSLF